MKRKVGYKKRFLEMSYKKHEDAAVVVDAIIEKSGNCKDIKGLYRTLRFLPMGNKEFSEIVALTLKDEVLTEHKTVVFTDLFIRNLKFKVRCLLALILLLDFFINTIIKRKKSVNVQYFRNLVSDIQDCFNLPDEVQCSKSIYKIMDIISKMQDEKIYEKFKEIPEEYQNLILLEAKTLAVLLTKYTQEVTGGQQSSEKIDKMIEEVDKIREQIPVKEFGEEIKDEKLESARMWTNETKPEGDIINKEEFDKYVKNKSTYQIFIIDGGEYEMGSVGKVYLGNRLILKQEDSGEKKSKKKKEKDYLTPYEYKLLIYTLKNKYRAGTIIELVEKCWGKKSLVEGPKGLRESLKNDKDTFMRETSTYRKTIANLSTLLNNEIGLRLRSYKTGCYSLTGKPAFCLLVSI